MDQTNPAQSPQMPAETPVSTPFSAPSQQPAQQPPPPPPGLPSQLPPSPEVTQAKGGSKKMMMVFIMVLIALILAVGGYYYYITMQKAPSGANPETENTAASVNEFDGLETEVKNIEVTDPADDLMDVDKEINLLDASASPSASVKR